VRTATFAVGALLGCIGIVPDQEEAT
jgi:hypothetical protein